MLFILVAMVLILALAGFVLAYATWAFRGEGLPAQLPTGRWLDRTMERVADLDPALRPEASSDQARDQERQASLVG